MKTILLTVLTLVVLLGMFAEGIQAQGSAIPRKVKSIPGSCDPTGTRGDVILWKIAAPNNGLYLCDPDTDTFQYQTNTFAASLVVKTMLYADAAGAIVSTAAPTNGQLLIGSTGLVPALGTLTGTANETLITNGAGSITIGLAATLKHKVGTSFHFQDPADVTKVLQLDASNITTGTTRSVAVPDSDTKVPIASQFLTFSGPTAARTITIFDANFSAARRNDFNAQTNVAAPATPAAGITNTWTDATDKNLQAKDDAGVITVTVKPDAVTANQWISAISSAGVVTKSQPDSSNLSDGTNLAKLDAGNTNVNVAAPATPAAGNTALWTDVTDKNLQAKDDAGVITVTVKPDAGTASQWVRSVSSAGVVGKSQPASSDLSDAANVAMRNVANTFTKANTVTPAALTDAATIATDASLSNNFRVTLGGNRTLGNPTNPTDGQIITWELIQDGTGGRTIALDTKFALGTDIASVVLTTTASKRDFLTVVYNSSADKFFVRGFVKGY